MIDLVEHWLAVALIAVPALFAAWTVTRRVEATARRLTLAGAALTALLAVGALGTVLVADRLHLLHRIGAGAAGLFVLDGENAVSVCLIALVALAGALGGARSGSSRVGGAALLATEGALLGLVTTANMGVFIALWVATLVPVEAVLSRTADPKVRDRERTSHRGVILGTAAALTLGVALQLAATGQRSLSLTALASHHASPGVQRVIFALLGAAVMARMRAFPLHTWVPVLLGRGPVGLLVAVGMHLLTRVVMPMLPDATEALAPALAAIGLLGSLVGSVVAVVQTDLRYTLGMVMVSQVGMVLQGLATRNVQSVSGALFEAAASGLCVTALALLVDAIESRAGTTEVTELGGVARSAPKLAALFVVFSYAAVGIPGSPTFVGEDLLLHGIIEHHPVVATVLLLATVLNGVSLFRAIARGLLGPGGASRAAPRVSDDLVGRERVALLGLLALVIMGGVAPRPLLSLRDPAVQAIVSPHR